MADAAPSPGGGKVNVPGVGKVKPLYIVLGVGGVGLLIVLKNRSKSAAAGSAAAGQSTDPAGNVGVIDPATGYVYGSPQDQAALGTAAGSSAAGGGGGDSGTGSIGSQVTNGPPFTTDAAWSQYAITVLSGNGYDAGTVTDELGMYINGAAVTPLQEDDINAAIAVAGFPPVAGANGYPPAINVNGSKQGGGGSGSGSGSSGSGSGSSGSGSGGSAGRLNQPQGVRLVLQYTNSVRLQWDEVQGADGYVVQAKKGGPNGQVVNGPFSTVLALANIGGLQSGTQYTALIWPSDKSDAGGPGSNQPHAEFSFSTK